MDTLVGVFTEPDRLNQALAQLIGEGIPAAQVSLLLTYGLHDFGMAEFTGDPVPVLGACGGTWKGHQLACLAGAPYFFTALDPLLVLGRLVNAALDATEAGMRSSVLDTILEQRFSNNDARLCRAALSNGCAVIAAGNAVRRPQQVERMAIER